MPITSASARSQGEGERKGKQKNLHLRRILGADPSTSSTRLSSRCDVCNGFSSVVFNEQSISRRVTDLLLECHLLGDYGPIV